MLALSRRTGESILIGSNIKITLVQIKGRQAKISIEAPREIPVLREEIANLEPDGPPLES